MRRILRSLVRAVAFVLALIIAALSLYIAANYDDARRFPKIISAYYAKEACSCLYVLQRSEPQCHEMVRQYVPISSFRNDAASKKVSVRGLGRDSVAAFIDARHGCRLVE